MKSILLALRRKTPKRTMIVVQRDTNLLKIDLALHMPRCSPCRLNHWQQQPHQNRRPESTTRIAMIANTTNVNPDRDGDLRFRLVPIFGLHMDQTAMKQEDSILQFGYA